MKTEDVKMIGLTIAAIVLVAMLFAPFIRLMDWWFCLWGIGCK